MGTGPHSPEDRRLFDTLVDVIREELQVCFDMERFEEPDGVAVTSDLIADVIWDVFEVRSRLDQRTRDILEAADSPTDVWADPRLDGADEWARVEDLR